MKKVWTPAARAAFALKMKRARAAKGTVRRRRKNPTKEQVKAAAKSIAKKAASLAWRGTKLTGRTAKAGAKAAAAEVKASICRPRSKNPFTRGFEVRMGNRKKRKVVWTAQTKADAVFIAKTFAKAYPHKVVSVHAEK